MKVQGYKGRRIGVGVGMGLGVHVGNGIRVVEGGKGYIGVHVMVRGGVRVGIR